MILKKKLSSWRWSASLTAPVAVLLAATLMYAPAGKALAPPDQLTGAVYTTDVGCTGVNLNIFPSKDDVYLDGGPNGGGSGLPDGYYYVKVTTPNDTLLGTSGLFTPVHVTNGKFDQCYKLMDIVTQPDNSPGFADTTNSGGEYKVWVSPTSDFDKKKTDNFKVNSEEEDPPAGTLKVFKFYDANADGIDNDSQPITGWKVRIVDSVDYIRFTPVEIIVVPDLYTITEFQPNQTNWKPTTPVLVETPLSDGQTVTVTFGNLCLGAGGGLTLGFWSNKNGQALVGADDLACLTGLNLRDGAGADFDPASHATFRTWILGASATNMAYMLSAQLAAMKLNVHNGKVNGGSMIYAPGVPGANVLGYATVNTVIDAANTSLGLYALTLSGNAQRATQEAIKNALDKANNNVNFVQSKPCPFSFPEEQ